MKLLAFEHLRDGVLGQEPHEIVRRERAHPAPVEVDHGLLRIENLEYLSFISLRILFHLLTAERRARGRTARRIADHAGEIADQKNGSVPEILKMFQFAQ